MVNAIDLGALALIDKLIVTRPTAEIKDDLESYWATIRGFRATYIEAITKARASDDPWDPAITVSTLGQFDAVAEELLAATTPFARETLVERAEELGRTRAYLFPECEILLQAKVCLADMEDWGVPGEPLRTMRSDLLPDLRAPEWISRSNGTQRKVASGDRQDRWGVIYVCSGIGTRKVGPREMADVEANAG
jgi:hypothetical protein